MSGAFLSCSLSFYLIFETRSLSPKLRLIHHQTLGILLSQLPQWLGYRYIPPHPAFLCEYWAWCPSPSLHADTVHTSLSQPCPSPLCSYKLCMRPVSGGSCGGERGNGWHLSQACVFFVCLPGSSLFRRCTFHLHTLGIK